MMLKLQPGIRIYSVVDTTELIVIKASNEPYSLTIGGVPASLEQGNRDDRAEPTVDGVPTVMGKRYTDSTGSLEVICTKAGRCAVEVDGEGLAVKDAKPLPASD